MRFLIVLLLFSARAVAAPPEVEIRVQGVDDAVQKAVVAGLSLARERGHELFSAHRMRRLHRIADQEILRTLQAFGHYRARVEGELEKLGEQRFRATYRIDPGAPVRVAQVSLEIAGDAADDEVLAAWRRRFPLAAGTVLRHRPYEQAKTRLLELAQQRGYLDAELTRHTIRVDPTQNTAVIALQLDSGPRYRFGEVTFSDVPLSQELLQRYLPFQPGDPYESDVLFELQAALTASDYFAGADVFPAIDRRADGRVPVTVELTMRERTRYTVGLGYGTDTGPRATLGVERRWLNRHGHRIGFELTGSDVLTTAEASYRVPLQRPETDFITYAANHSEEDTDETYSRTESVSASVTHLLTKWRRTVSLTVSDESYTVGDEGEDSVMIYPGIAFQRYRTDERFFPRGGWRLGLLARTASENLGSATDMLQGEVRAKLVEDITDHSRILLRVDAAGSKVPDFESLPVSLRYFAGGDNSIRGFAYKSLGPKDADGDVVGGHNLLTASVELDYYLPYFDRRLGFAVFTDGGNAFDSDLEWSQGAGIGVRWRFPFGQLRADVAAAISEPGDPWRFHLSIGPDL